MKVSFKKLINGAAKPRTIILFVILSAAFSAGCMNSQFERVAKDWALLIRACQMIPVYPPTEDLQPGDTFLVTIPLEKQVEIYNKKGFLPLDQLIVRLYSDPKVIKSHANDFVQFYDSRYGITGNTLPPANWQQSKNWETAPSVAFPTYNFTLETGSGLKLALPIQGIPFALGLMRSGRAHGTVKIMDAHTYGLDNYRLEYAARLWAVKNADLLSKHVNNGLVMLRVASRVYTAGRVSISIEVDETTGARVEAGDETPLDLMGIKKGATKENYEAAIDALNDLVHGKLGAAIKVVAATSHSITLEEKFTKPLILGYVGFDMQISFKGIELDSGRARVVAVIEGTSATLTNLTH